MAMSCGAMMAAINEVFANDSNIYWIESSASGTSQIKFKHWFAQVLMVQFSMNKDRYIVFFKGSLTMQVSSFACLKGR